MNRAQQIAVGLIIVAVLLCVFVAFWKQKWMLLPVAGTLTIAGALISRPIPPKT